MEDYPEIQAKSNVPKDKDKSDYVALAPGEDKTPVVNILSEKNWDVDGFPCLFGSGQFGIDCRRNIKISKSKILQQRLHNFDSRFRDNKQFLYASVNYMEQEQLNGKISHVLITKCQIWYVLKTKTAPFVIY